MKHKLLIILGIAFILLSSLVLADVITPGTVSISYCARLENVEDFPDYVFVAKIVGPMIGVSEEYQTLESKECIYMGYKFKTAEIYAMNKADYAGSESDIDETKLIPLNADINRMVYTSMWDPRSAVTESFRIYSSGETLKLDKSVKVSLLSVASLFYIIAIAALITMIMLIRRRK